MANVLVNLPLPVLNGAGASVATSTVGSNKTVIVVGNFQGASIIVEASTDGGTVFAPVAIFQNVGRELSVFVVASHMRARVTGRKTTVPFAATVDVGAPLGVPTFSALTIPAGNGPGAALDISAFPEFCTFIAGGAFSGCLLTIEISDDNVDFAPLVSFSGSMRLASRDITANWVRVNVSGRKDAVPFSATVSVGASSPPSGGGSGGVVVQHDGVDIVNPALTLNFREPGTLVTNAGGQVADVWATLLPTEPTVTPGGGGTFTLVAGKLNLVNATNGTPAFAAFPAASSVPDGEFVAIKISSNGAVHDGSVRGTIVPQPNGADTLDGRAENFNYPLNIEGQCQLWVSDGVANWSLVADFDPSGSVPAAQSFPYIATGAENPDGFTVNFPQNMTTTQYGAWIELFNADANNFYEAKVSAKALGSITVQTTVAPTAGDILDVFVKLYTTT